MLDVFLPDPSRVNEGAWTDKLIIMYFSLEKIQVLH